MEPEFWHQRWALKQIGFHEPEGNAFLVKWFDQLGLTQGQRVFVPLCGKSRDIHWLLSKGFRVVGVELSEIAVVELFEELQLKPEISNTDALSIYSSPGLDIFVGDIFDLSPQQLGQVDAVYDRAALVAMPESLRKQYCNKLIELSDCSPQLLISFEYEQALMDGPPFSVDRAMISSLYAAHYAIQSLEIAEVSGGLKGICPAQEQVWLLS